MRTLDYTIKNPAGFHYRVAAILAIKMRKYWTVKISVQFNDAVYHLSDAVHIFQMKAKEGDTIQFGFEGQNVDEAYDHLAEILPNLL